MAAFLCIDNTFIIFLTYYLILNEKLVSFFEIIKEIKLENGIDEIMIIEY